MSVLFESSSIIDELADRLDEVERILDVAHGGKSGSAEGAGTTNLSSIEREARGLSVLLMFAAYENLLKSCTRQLIESAIQVRVHQSRLTEPFFAIAMQSSIRGVRDTGERKLPLKSKHFARSVRRRAQANLDTSFFPDDGSFMKLSQVQEWCKFFDSPTILSTLGRIAGHLDGVVSDRNAIAHGRVSPSEVGRRRSEPEVRQLLTDWRTCWTDFVRAVEVAANDRAFYRT